MKIALVGGHGFIGHHLALALKASGHEPFVVDSLSINNALTVGEHPEYLAMCHERAALLNTAGVPVMYLDARQYSTFTRLVAPMKPQAIVHLAAVAHIDRSNKDPHSTFDNSLVTLENSLDVARSIGSHIVFFSSSTAYGDFKKPVVTEDEHCEPRGIYGSLKLAGELMVKAYGDLGVPFSIVRPCALYGARCVSGRVTQKIVELAHAGKPIKIDGDGTGKHDFTYVADLVDGTRRLIEKGPTGQVFNITAGQARSLNDLVEIVRRDYPNLKAEYGPADPQKPSRGTMSVAAATRSFGYLPRWSLERGMGEYIAWYKAFRNRLDRQAA